MPKSVHAVAKMKSAAKRSSSPSDPKKKVTRHVDQRVAARNSALNAFGGVIAEANVFHQREHEVTDGLFLNRKLRTEK